MPGLQFETHINARLSSALFIYSECATQRAEGTNNREIDGEGDFHNSHMKI